MHLIDFERVWAAAAAKYHLGYLQNAPRGRLAQGLGAL